MGIPAKINDVVREMEMISDEVQVYLHRLTGEFVSVTDDDIAALEYAEEGIDVPDWQRDHLPNVREAIDSDDYVSLPGKFEIHEWDIMRRFSESTGNDEQSRRLTDALHGRGAFRRFKDETHRLGFTSEWDEFFETALKKIAVDWLEANNIPYIQAAGQL